jgi:hypothetical protein
VDITDILFSEMSKRPRSSAGSDTEHGIVGTPCNSTLESEVVDVYVDDDEASDGDVDEEELEILNQLIDTGGIVRSAAIVPLVSDAHCLVRFQRFCLFQANLPALSFRSLINMTLLITHALGVSLK